MGTRERFNESINLIENAATVPHQEQIQCSSEEKCHRDALRFIYFFHCMWGWEKEKKTKKKKQVCKGRGSYRESNHVEIVEWKVKAGGDRYAEIQTVIWCLHIPPPCCFCLIYAGIIWWTDKDLSPPPQITFFHFAALADIAIGRIKEWGGWLTPVAVMKRLFVQVLLTINLNSSHCLNVKIFILNELIQKKGYKCHVLESLY